MVWPITKPQIEQANAYYEQALQLDPATTKLYVIRPTCCCGKNYPDALANYQAAIAINPNFANAHLGLGIANYQLKNYAAALDNFNTAERLAATTATPLQRLYFYRGSAQLALKNYTNAITDYDRALAEQPKDAAQIYYYRGCATNAAKTDRAIADYSQAINLQADFNKAIAARANAYYEIGQYAGRRKRLYYPNYKRPQIRRSME